MCGRREREGRDRGEIAGRDPRVTVEIDVLEPGKMPVSAWTFSFGEPDIDAAQTVIGTHGGTVLEG